ncbi:NgoBV family restriction endonuclease [Enterococcus diestrammenae]|uniref:NgoBV family restriction endonuclease n=1 Tax=Enterococcus diestrammenae TaxID=1155073 RepID=UPI0019562552
MSTIRSLDDLYQLALLHLKGKRGNIVINLDGIPKISNSNDIIGNCLQEWIPRWLSERGLELQVHSGDSNTQAFPDFKATIDGYEYDMEVKCWNSLNSPGFDLANFDGLYRTLFNNPGKLNAKYLIFGYTPVTDGFIIQDIYLKNIWEITSKSQKYPIGLQVKQGNPYAIRPFAFHKRPDDCFETRRDFVIALAETREMFRSNNPEIPSAQEWLGRVEKKYKIYTGEEL